MIRSGCNISALSIVEPRLKLEEGPVFKARFLFSELRRVFLPVDNEFVSNASKARDSKEEALPISSIECSDKCVTSVHVSFATVRKVGAVLLVAKRSVMSCAVTAMNEQVKRTSPCCSLWCKTPSTPRLLAIFPSSCVTVFKNKPP